MTLYALGEVRPNVPSDNDYYVAPGAHVIGNVTLEQGASVWFGAVLRGDNELIRVGQGSNIQENSVLHTDAGYPLTIGENCTIGHKAMLHGCTIEDGALIGMGATILNGAVIGAGTLVAAGALVPENKVIPPGGMVFGAPGRIADRLTAKHTQGMEAAAKHYQVRMQQYKADLTPID